jgi:hypothetical protein
MSSILKVDTIQDQAGNNIINESSDTITIGASGDTITIPSGATLSSTDPLVFPAGTVSLPSITTTGDTNTGIFFPAADTIAFTEGGTEAMRINSSGRLGIGTTNPTSALHVSSASIPITFNSTDNANIIQLSLASTTGGYIGANGTNLIFSNNVGTEAMRIDSSGDVHIGRTADTATAGITLRADGIIKHVVDGNVLHVLNRLTSDGTLVAFFQADVEEGSISVSGNTVSYNGFTGSHWSRFIDESKPDVLRGTVMETLDEMIDWYNLEFEVSTTEKDAEGNDVVKTTTQKKPYALKDNEQEGDVITYNWNTLKKDEET